MYLFINIGIKHAFLCINICWAPREVLKPEPESERRGVQHLPRGPADVTYQKSMFDRYYCIKTFFFFSLENFGGIVSKSSFFPVYL